MLSPLKPYEGTFSNFGVFDIETSKLSAKDFKFGIAYVDKQFHIFHDKTEMLKFLLQEKFWSYRWYGHNIEYDLSSLYENILTIPGSEILMNGSRFIQLKVCVHEKNNGIDKRKGKNTQKTTKIYVNFWDTFNIIPLSLKKIGTIFKLQKLKYSEYEIDKNSDAAIEYCKRDCEITSLIVEKYQSYCQKFNIKPRLTTSSTAMAIFRTNFLKERIWIDDNDIFFKNSYVGGRTEVFQKVLKKGYHYDINSLYPAAMSEKSYPNPSKIKKGVLSNFDYNLNNFEGVAHIKVESPNLHIPVLPYRVDGKVIFPIGVFDGWYNFNELRFAVSRGYKILKIYDYYFCESMNTPFKEYVDYWYNQKSAYKDKDPGFYDFSKRMMNGLYGKFGEYHDSGDWGHISDDYNFDEYIFNEVKDGYGTWEKKNETLPEQITTHTIFSWCSYVTSYARILLYKEIEKSGNVAYVDTDSKFCNKYQESSNKLGEMKLEHSNINCYFYAPKMYQILPHIECRDYIQYSIEKSVNKDDNKIKGIKLAGKDIFQKSYSQNRVMKSKEALRRNIEAGKWIKVVKDPTGKDTKRLWNKDGTSLPIKICV